MLHQIIFSHCLNTLQIWNINNLYRVKKLYILIALVLNVHITDECVVNMLQWSGMDAIIFTSESAFLICSSFQMFYHICIHWAEAGQRHVGPIVKHGHNLNGAPFCGSNGVCYNSQHDPALCQLALKLHGAVEKRRRRRCAGREGWIRHRA